MVDKAVALDHYLRERRQTKELLVMTHVVCGYPSFEDNWKELEIMAAFDVDVVELQFPFSEPSADGPLFVRANELALKAGVTPADCFRFMARVSAHFPFKVLMMGYYNTVFKMGAERFIDRLKDAGGSGFIIPDLPLAESAELHALSDRADLAPVVLMTPTSTDRNLEALGRAARGMIYAVARKGVTGAHTDWSEELDQFLARCRRVTDLPIGVGFGVSSRGDIDYLRGRADMAIIGTAALKAWEAGGDAGLRDFFGALGIN